MSKEWDDIKVNRRKGDDVRFESSTIQSIYDGIEFLRDEATQILRDMLTVGPIWPRRSLTRSEPSMGCR